MNRDSIIQRVKLARSKRFITNCYSMGILDRINNVWENDEGFIFSYEDHGVDRLAYFVKDKESLDDLIRTIDKGKYYLEYMTNDYDEGTPYGSISVARMLRMTNPDCRSVFDADSQVLKYEGSCVVEQASERDSKELTKVLWRVFRPEISHLVYEEELRLMIGAGQITVHRMDSCIDALLQADVKPKRFYINQIVNLGDRKNVHALLLDRLRGYVTAGGRYVYAWVEDKNVASLKFHQKYGMEHDGMMSVIYFIER